MSEKRPGIDKVMAWLAKQQNPIVVDLGAYTGKTVRLALEANPTAHVYAVEPCRKNFKILKKRYEFDGRVTCVNMAIGFDDSETILYTVNRPNKEGSSQSNTLFREPLKAKKRAGRIKDYKEQVVQARTLKTFLTDFRLRAVTLLKVNVEGAEYYMFQELLPVPMSGIFISWHMHPPFDGEHYTKCFRAALRSFERAGLKVVSEGIHGDHVWHFWRKDAVV